MVMETIMVDPGKHKTTWLLPKPLMKRIKQYALDHDTNATVVAIEAFEEFLNRRSKK
jgi:hypothetical protein